MNQINTATDVVLESIRTGRDVAEILDEAIGRDSRPAWAENRHLKSAFDCSSFWYERRVGESRRVVGAFEDEPRHGDVVDVWFTLIHNPEPEPHGAASYVEQKGSQIGVFADPGAMRAYAAVLLEAADAVELLVGGQEMQGA